jgi:hypothetical protein
MDYCDNWEQVQDRYRAFWANEALDRPVIRLTVPREPPLPGPPAPEPPRDWRARWTDADYITARTDHVFRSSEYLGEAFPSLFVNLGPGIMATYFGSPTTCDANTIWFHPILRDWEKDAIRFDPESWWWKRTKELTQAAVNFGADKFFVGITDLGGPSDILASLRGSIDLQMDFLLNPEPVARALRTIVQQWTRCYAELQAIINQRLSGTAQWMSIWSPGRMYNIQSDLCCMLSPALFEKFILPEIEAQCQFLDDVTFHLDGPGAIKHLDRICAVPNLKGIQWTPGAGQPNAADWLPMLQRLQRRGKLLCLHEHVSKLEKLVRSLSPRGLLIDVWGVSSRQEGLDLLRLAAQWAGKPDGDP